MSNSIQKGSMHGGNKTIATYHRDGLELPVASISEYIVLKGGAIAANTTYTLNLEKIKYPITLLSIFIEDGNNTNTYTVSIENLGNYTFNKNGNPHEFNANIIDTTKNLSLSVINAVDGFKIVAKQSWLLSEVLC